MSKAASVSKYEIMTLSKGEKEVRLEGMTVAFDYYESIRSPNVTATMMIVDTGGSIKYSSKYDKQERYGSIYNALPLSGNEKLRFKIKSILCFKEKVSGTIFFRKRLRSEIATNFKSRFTASKKTI